jgi:anti-anti-sigma regulatory factor
MSLHVLTHPWEVQDLEHGPLVRIHPRDLDAATISTLIDEMFELVQESGQPHLSLDFAAVHVLPALVVGKLFALQKRLEEAGGRLLLCNLSPSIKELLQAESWSSPWDEAPPAPDGFVVFVREECGTANRPESLERPLTACPTYTDAARVREQLRQSGRNCVIRFVGETGGGD